MKLTQRIAFLVSIALAATPGGARALPLGERDPGAREELTLFLRQLERVRRGEDAEKALRASSERLCAEHARCDARDVAAYYLGLSVEERRRGLEDERAFGELWERVLHAGEGNVTSEDWKRAVRPDVLRDLRAFVDRVRAAPDFVPAARGQSLAARIAVEEVENALELDPASRLEKLERAEADCREAIELFERAGLVTPRLEPLWLLGRIELARGHAHAARRRYEDCLALATRVDNADFREHALHGLLGLARDRGDVAAIDALLAELATFRTPAESWVLARAHVDRLIHADHPREALDFLRRNAPEDPSEVLQWHVRMGNALLRMGDLDGARVQFEQFDPRKRDELAMLVRASVALEEERFEDVLDELAALDLAGGFTPRGRAEALALLGEAFLGVDDPASAAAALEDALAVAETWRAQIERQDRESAGAGSVIGEWLGLHTVVLLARAQAELGDGVEVARVIEDYQSRTLREAGAAPPKVAREDVRRFAESFDAGLVTWVVGADDGVVCHVARDGSAWASRIPHGRRAVQRAVRRLREALIAGDRELTEQLCRDLEAELVPEPLARRLADAPQAGGARVLALLHGPLEELPIEALPTFSGEATALVPAVLPGLPADAPGAYAGGAAEWTLAGDPRETGLAGLPMLSGARAELDELARLHPRATLFAGAEFERANLVRALAGAAPLHVATHLCRGCGCRGGRLAEIGLLLSSGDVLCAREIEELAPGLPLVVLSACETAGGRFVDAEGLQGLARAFLEGGTRNLLVTLWPVEDDAARRFALAFHEALSREGVLPSVAAREARRVLREAGFGPSDWAAFRLLGRD